MPFSIACSELRIRRESLRTCCAEPHQFKKSERRIRENALKAAGGAGSENTRKGKGEGKTKANSRAGREVLGNLLLCQFHPGRVVNKVSSLEIKVCAFTDIL